PSPERSGVAAVVTGTCQNGLMPSTQSSRPNVGPSSVSMNETSTPAQEARAATGRAPTSATDSPTTVQTAGTVATAWTRTSVKDSPMSARDANTATSVPATSTYAATTRKARAAWLA